MKNLIYNVYKLVKNQPSMLILQTETKETVLNFLREFEFNDAVNKLFEKHNMTKREKRQLVEDFYKLYDMTLTKIVHVSKRVSQDLQTVEALIVVVIDKL